MMIATPTIRQINGHGIWWLDQAGLTHTCEGTETRPGDRRFRTLCEQDVPANTMFRSVRGDKDKVCPACLARQQVSPA